MSFPTNTMLLKLRMFRQVGTIDGEKFGLVSTDLHEEIPLSRLTLRLGGREQGNMESSNTVKTTGPENFEAFGYSTPRSSTGSPGVCMSKKPHSKRAMPG